MKDNHHIQALFVQQFRNAAPYIQNFRRHIFVIYISSRTLTSTKIQALVQDISLLHSFGIKLLIVHGAREHIDQQLQAVGHQSTIINNLRLTDSQSIITSKQVCGQIRFDLEALFATTCHFHPDVDNISSTHRCITLNFGNYVIAQPVGILEGIDYQLTGKVRRIRTDAIHKMLDLGHIVVLSPVASSPTGECFNINSEDLALECAGVLQAEKLLYLGDISGIYNEQQQLIPEISARVLMDIAAQKPPTQQQDLYLRFAKACIHKSVKKIHVINQDTDGAILLELFTNKGHGSLVSQDSLEQIEKARPDDIMQIAEIIEPLQQKNIMIKRSREHLELEIDYFHVIKREDRVIACAALYPDSDSKMGELACLAVHPDFQNAGRGNQLFEYICDYARANGLQKLYALTTQTSHWFLERGFQACPTSALPKFRQSQYNFQRNSAVYVKKL